MRATGNPMKKLSTMEQIKKTVSDWKMPRLWKSLDQITQAPEYEAFRADDFPYGASPLEKPISRKNFLKVMGAPLAMAALAGCDRQPREEIVPYVKSVEEIVPGKPLYFSTSMMFRGRATGLRVTSHMGRPTFIAGNPLHPDSLGAVSTYHQAAILDLYDPDRSKEIFHQKKPSDWDSFVKEMSAEISSLSSNKGEGLRILTESTSSPTLLRQLDEILKKYPSAKRHAFEPISENEMRKAQEAVFGKAVDAVYHFKRAKIVVALDSDFLSDTPGHLRYSRDLMQLRSNPKNHKKMNRIYTAEPSPTLTGSIADHRLAVSSEKIEALTEQIAKALGVSAEWSPSAVLNPEETKWISAAIEDLKTNRGASIVIAGPHQSAWVHALVYAINFQLGNFTRTLTLYPPVDRTENSPASLEDLVQDLRQNKVRTLLILDSNPVYAAPRDWKMDELLAKVPQSIYWGLYRNETSQFCKWHIPAAHFLETFSDGCGSDSTLSLAQPLIAPLYDGKNAHELLALLAGDSKSTAYEIVQETWKQKWGASFETQWKKTLHDGMTRTESFKPVTIPTLRAFTKKDLAPSSKKQNDSEIEILFRQDPSVWDGRFANNSWLQELPKPMTKLTWDNAALVSPQLAESLKLENGRILEIRSRGEVLRAPVWIMPGQAAKSIVLPLGYGRTSAGQVGNGHGFDAYALRFSDQLFSFIPESIGVTQKKTKLVTTQNHSAMEGRELVRSASVDQYLENPHFAAGHHHGPIPSFYPPLPKSDNAWGMVINLNSCIGCNACVIACQSENNIPVVGKDQVRRGREMHWLRIDNYYEGTPENPAIHHQPVPCMHCENAPCEPVCPVGATNHSPDGLNQMIYNRCVGTRYCSNNCPYKVRRFNFYDYIDKAIESFKLMRNPDVTVRSRGVMEKCTFCVQRINHTRIDAKKEGRAIGGNEVVTACQAACPTQAITFGDLNNPASEVSALKKHDLNYVLLEELNTKPRVSYHAKVKNLHPQIGEHRPIVSHGGVL